MFRHIDILGLEGHLCQSLPIGLSLVVELRVIENERSLLQILRFKSKPKVNERLVQRIRRDGIATAIRDQNLSLPILPLNALYITFNVINSDLLRMVDRVPNIQILAILSHNDLTLRHPLRESAIRQQGALGERGQVVNIELFSLVFEEQLIGVCVELEVIYL